MYIDPNTGGMLFQILATGFALLSGVVLLFSGKIRAGIARVRRSWRDRNGQEQNETAAAETAPSDKEN